MTRVPGSNVDSTSFTPTTSDTGTPADSSVGGFRVAVEYQGMRWFYGQTNANQTSGSLQARQLAKIAARLAALKRRIAARRQRRGLRGAGGDDDFDGELVDGMHDEHRRAEAGSGTGGGGGGGSGGQSHHDEHGSSWSGDSAPKVEFKAQNIRPVREPAPGALAARLTAEGGGTVKHEQLADDWCAALVSQREKIAADPRYQPDPEYFDAVLDLLRMKEQFGSPKPQGMATWREKLKTLLGARPVKASTAAGAESASLAAPAGRRELTRLESFHALLPLKALMFDASHVPSRTRRSINTVMTQRNALLARHGKR